ncbi:SRPBCC family protein [Chitinimonas naiadis]
MEQGSATDRIERKIVIQAPRERVWRALASAEEFGNWFGASIQDQTFAPGKRVRGQVTVCGHEHVYFDVVVERMEPPTLFSYRWHPSPIDPAVDYELEEPTLVTFTLQEMADKTTLLTVVETGFDKLPPHRRLEAFRMNNNGWDAKVKCIANHVIQ